MFDINALTHGGAYAEAETRRYRAECLVRCLEASLDRVAPEDFDKVMTRLENAQAELAQACRDVLAQRWRVAEEEAKELYARA